MIATASPGTRGSTICASAVPAGVTLAFGRPGALPVHRFTIETTLRLSLLIPTSTDTEPMSTTDKPKSTHPAAVAFPNKHPTRICSEPFCGRPAHGWGAFCGNHAARQYKYGHASLRAGIRETELRSYAKWVGAGLARYRNTKGTESVLKLITERVLNFNQPDSCVRAERDLTRIMQEYRYHEVSASDVLARVAIFQAYSGANAARFRGSLRAENIALARMVLRLVPMSRAGKRYPTKAIERLADELRRCAVPYANRLLQLVQEEAARLHEGVLASLDLSTPADVPADSPRAGRGRRKRLGVETV